jgi:hypothetical protein
LVKSGATTMIQSIRHWMSSGNVAVTHRRKQSPNFCRQSNGYRRLRCKGPSLLLLSVWRRHQCTSVPVRHWVDQQFMIGFSNGLQNSSIWWLTEIGVYRNFLWLGQTRLIGVFWRFFVELPSLVAHFKCYVA